MPVQTHADQLIALCAVWIRVSQDFEHLGDGAAEMIVEENLLLSDSPITADEIRDDVLTTPLGLVGLNRERLVRTLDRLVAEGKVIRLSQDDAPRYALSTETREVLLTEQAEGERRYREVIRRHFREQADRYDAPFRKIVYRFFAEMGEGYLAHLDGGSPLEDPAGKRALVLAMESVADEDGVDAEVLRRAVQSFLGTHEPDAILLKWTLCQNFFVLKTLGLDPDSLILSRALFTRSVFFLDTNLVVDGLVDVRKSHRDFHRLMEACKSLDIEVVVSAITLTEFNDFVQHQIQWVEYKEGLIPEKPERRMDTDFRRRYEMERGKAGFSIEGFFRHLMNPAQRLRLEYGIEVVDDAWFERAADSPQTKQDAATIRLYAQRARRGRPKGKLAAEHDAIMLRRIRRDSSAEKPVWFVTSDTTLPPSKVGEQERGARWIALTALLHWISPLARGGLSGMSYADIFSEAMNYQLLPSRTFFTSTDFRVFKEWKAACGDIAPTDVQRCFSYIQCNAPDIDLLEHNERSLLARGIKANRTDSVKRHEERVAALEARVAELETTVGQQDEALNKKTEFLAKTAAHLTAASRRRRAQTVAVAGVLSTGYVALAWLGWAIVDNPLDSNFQAFKDAILPMTATAGFGLTATRVAIARDLKALGGGLRSLFESAPTEQP
ncbi:MAG: hypothetical protein M3323_02290 [Actinomycetota bacterium]|nr:hypothetical protein [Actinomycetota bacterium]